MSLSPPPTYDAHSNPYVSTTSLKPYLELPHLLSLTWLAYPILSLLFIAFRLQLSLASAQDDVANAKADLLASCQAAQKAATAAASMPRYMAIATNDQFVTAVNDSMNAARATLVLALTVMEAIINFIVDIYRSTLLCFVELIVRGALSLVIGAVSALNDVIQDVASGISTAIQDSISGANSAITSAIDAINKVNPFGNISIPQISSPDLSALNNVSLPSSFQDSLNQLNSSLPTFSQLKDDINAILDTPFELLKKDINDTFAGLSFNSSLLTVPEQNEVSFCDQLDTSVVDDLGQDLIKITKIGVIIIVILALLLVGLNCLLEWYKWRCQQAHLQYTREAWSTDPSVTQSKGFGAPSVTLTDHNLLMLQANGSHPLITRIMNQLSARLHFSPTTYTNLSWFLHYIFHAPALACFLIGFFGLLSVEIQLIAVHPLEAKYSALAASTATDFSNTIATSMNASMYNQSATYANNVNSHIDTLQSSINDGLFGWVNGTTTTLNDTLATFYSDIQDAISDAFNGTLLEEPLQEFLACFIGSKVEAIEDALTFLNNNLQIDMPRMNDTILVLSPESINEVSQPIAAAAVGDGSDDNGGFVGKLVNAYVASLKKERIMFGIFMGLWGVVVLMAIFIILWSTYGKRYIERRRQRKWEREQRCGVDGLVVPFRLGQPASEKPATDFLSFTPPPTQYFSDNAAGSSRAPQSSDPKTNKSWENFFGAGDSRKKPFPAISKPFKLMPAVGNQPGRAGPGQDDQFGKTWFTRLTGTFTRKISDPQSVSPTPPLAPSDRTRPDLRISIDRASSTRTLAQDPDGAKEGEPHSRWSTSPEVIKIAPWMGMLSPTRRSYDHGAPPNRTMRQDVRSIPADVNSVYESSAVHVDHAPLAPPLHHGFNGIPRSNIQAPSTLAPPQDRHRRSSSVPAWKMSPPVASSVTPVTRFLTSNSARRSSNVDPFATPFDDEHQVIVERALPRQSYQTNPFTVVAM
ncbi:MAG: hypothetical protein NXY57DRAFT_994238 [Lentinula lateritia]|uniref:Plasma membrane fusion protein PRM1 n=1 Tax=Lentinula lateritia TaxID=40482 RepID=A0ABQ8VWE0_9AGAR|nr:MAG: hypothetical protein NXY57DRAFT_994238 [Lentinula lateritia]KAJ4499830.1 hypothetical protein C8R41DRAFT_813867 [Lentinula lateritia]